MLFLGVDWGERHHDLCLLDQDGSVQAGRRRNLQTRVVAFRRAGGVAAAAPEPVVAAHREVVGALVATLGCLNQQVAALEQQLAARFADHRDAAIIRASPGSVRC